MGAIRLTLEEEEVMQIALGYCAGRKNGKRCSGKKGGPRGKRNSKDFARTHNFFRIFVAMGKAILRVAKRMRQLNVYCQKHSIVFCAVVCDEENLISARCTDKDDPVVNKKLAEALAQLIEEGKK